MLNRDGIKKILKILVITVVVIILIGYSLYASKDYLEGPKIIINEPQNGDTLSTSTIVIKGQALRIQDITINNRPILIDEKGNFNENLLLFPCYNVAVIFAKDKFNRTIEYKLELVYRE